MTMNIDVEKLIEELEDMIYRLRQEAAEVQADREEMWWQTASKLKAQATGIQMAIETIEEYM